MRRSSTLSRRRQHVIETLEERRLLSLSIDLRIDIGNAANTDPSSIINAHTIQSPQVGDVYQLQIWAQINGTDSNGSNDSLEFVFGSLISSNLRTGEYFGAVQGSFTIPALEPYYASSLLEASPGAQYTDANGNVNVGSTSTDSSEPQNFFHPVQDTTQALPPSNLLGQGSPGAGQEFEMATTTFTVTAVTNGPPTTLVFNPRPQPQGAGWVSALWFEDTALKDTRDGDAISLSTGITVTEPDTIAPTAAATLSPPIFGSTPSYQFTVNYSDNQDLNRNDFNSNNILVTGPNGYSQMATVVGSPVDADPSADTQYDPYNVTYQITPPDAAPNAAWSIADNGAYTFTLEAGQIADNSGNVAPSQVLGGGPMNVQFTGAVSISPATASIGENSTSPAEFTVTRTDALNNDFADAMTVNYTVTGNAVAGTNYTALSGTVTIPAGQSTATIDVQPIDDQLVDNDTAVTLTVSPGATYVLGTPTGATLTISNTDITAASIADISVGRSSSDQTANFTVTLSIASTVDLLVDYSTSDGTAIAGTDYTATSGVLTFPAGTTSETIPVTILGSTNSGDLSFNMNLVADPQSAADLTIANTPAVATISDVIPVTLTAPSAPVVPGLNATNAAFTVTLGTVSTLPITISYTTADGSAIAGTNYTATSGTLTFAPGQTTQTIDVPILPVIRDDGGKSFTLTISSTDALSSVDPSAATAIVSLATANFTELSINPKKGATYIDAAGNKVTVKVSGINASTFVGNILFPTGGPTTGVNAIGIVIDGTTAKSTLTISTKSTTLDFIDVNGSLKTLSAKGVSLSQSPSIATAPYFTTTGSATTVSLGAISGATITSNAVKTLTGGNLTGATVNIGGSTTGKMTFANIQDSEINDAAPLSAFSTTQWLNTDSTADLLSAAGLNSLKSKGTFQASVSAGIIGTVAIKGAWSNAIMAVTSVKKMSVGTASNSSLFASVNPNSGFTPSSSDLAAGGQITNFTVTSKAANAFSSTIIEAQYTGTLSLGSLALDSSAAQFGVATESIKSITVVEPSGKTSLKNLDNSNPGNAIAAANFVADVVG